MKPELELYLHIPFCARKCAYCDFFSGAFSDGDKALYFENLRQEIRERAEEPERIYIPGTGGGSFLSTELPVRSVFIGGGTPPLAPLSELAETVSLLRDRFRLAENAEFTIEANPGTLSEEKLRMYRNLGINRLSMGLQSPDDRMLRKLGRIHSFADFLESCEKARAAGFENISADLMSGLPGETPQNFEKGLKTVLSLSLEHLSVYSLIIEENTPFYALYGPSGTREDELPREEEDRAVYKRTKEILSEYGYDRYEISNYARRGFESLHNIGYWTGVPYLGFGAAAASFTGKLRKKNASALAYRSLPREEEETLSEEDLMSEFMILGFRMTEGVSDAEFYDRFGARIAEVFKEPLRRHLEIGTLEETEGKIRLTSYGLDVANAVMADFLITNE